MYVARLQLEFSEPCLGNERFPDPLPNKMLRSGDGDVVFLQAWWRTLIMNAADSFGKHQTKCRDIRWSPEVKGAVTIVRRYYSVRTRKGVLKRYKEHESFDRGSIIEVQALVPDDIPVSDFEEMLNLAGKFFGISPFGWKDGYGKFRLLKVENTNGTKED